MTQTTVNFLVNDGTGTAPVYQIDPRVFSLDISTDAQSYYIYEMNLLQAALTDYQTNPQNSVQDAQAIQSILTQLNSWSQLQIVGSNGTQVTGSAVGISTTSDGPVFTPPLDTNSPLYNPANGGSMTPIGTTMDSYMAQSVDNLIRTFRSAGWDPTTSDTVVSNMALTSEVSGALNNLTGTTTAGIYGIEQIIQGALSAASQASIIGNALSNFDSSIQQLLMVDYVSSGNQILFNEMNQLQGAVNTNQKALTYLNMLQDLINQKDPQQFVQQLQLLNSTDPTSGAVIQPGQTNYDNFESQTYNQALGTITRFLNGSDTTLQQYFQNIGTTSPDGTGTLANQAFNDISKAMPSLLSYSINAIIQNLTYLQTQIQTTAGSDGSALGTSISQVLADFTNLKNNGKDIQTWVEDTTTGSAGTYQQNLSNAIVASQSFNDVERENLSTVMFTYEEFYKSADSLLTGIDQLIEKMGSAISRG